MDNNKNVVNLNSRHFIENAIVGIFNSDLNGHLLFANEAFAKMLAYSSAEELLMTNALELYYDSSEREKLLEELLKNKRIDNYEIKLLSKDGRVKCFLLNEILEGDLISGIALDFTVRKIAEEEIKRARDSSEEMARLKTNFLANISHELRTPIIGILGFAELLNEELKNSELIPFVEAIAESGQRLKDTIEMILELTHIESSNLKLTFTEIKIHSIAENVISMYKELASKKKLYLNLVVENENLIAWLDSKMIYQVVNCLVNNALKFTQKGGVVVSVFEKVKDDKTWGVLKVKDTGVGIDTDEQKRIFKEFRQASEGSAREYQGIGLGLTIAKRFVELMNGEIYFSSTQGKGSVFTVEFPVFQSNNGNKENEVILSNILAEEKSLPTILLVEDESTIRKLIKLHLKKYCNIESAENAETALIMAKDKDYEAILMDINLSGKLNGLDVSRELRKLEEYQNKPIFALTAFANLLNPKELEEIKFTGVITKPFIKETLIRELKKIFIS